MTRKDSRPEQAEELRRRAEEIALGKAPPSPENREAPSAEKFRQTLHELRVHQIELTMQNEELRRAQAELDAVRARYFDLYDLAPVGYCTVSEKGLILEANLTAATLLRTARGALVKQPISQFVLKEDQAVYYLHRKQLFGTGKPQACELRMVKSDGTSFWAQLSTTAVQDGNGAPVLRIVMSDIAGRKRAEEALKESETTVRKELQAILDPEGDIGTLHLSDIIDHQALQTMMEDFYRLTRIGSAMLDLSGNVLVAVGWQDICMKFHRVHPDLWERGRISVATEHLATAITESLLSLVYPRLFAQPRLGKSAIVACVASESHQIGAKIVADLFELNGWRGYFLGANTPVRDVKALIAEKQPDVVALSVAVAFSLDTLITSAAEIHAAFPEVPILVGGQAFRWGGRERAENMPGVRCLTSMGELEAWPRRASIPDAPPART